MPNNLQEDNNKGRDINFKNLIMLNNPKEDNKGRDVNSSNLIALDNP